MSDMATGAPQEGTGDQKPQDGSGTGNKPQDGKKLSFAEQIAAYEQKDPEAAALMRALHSELGDTRTENARRRKREEALEARLNKLAPETPPAPEPSKPKEGQDPVLSRLEAMERLLLEERATRSNLETKAKFSEANDPNDVLAMWKDLSQEERAATTPEEFSADLKTKKPYLFKATAPETPPPGPNPRTETKGGTPPKGGQGFEIKELSTQKERDSFIDEVYKQYR